MTRAPHVVRPRDVARPIAVVVLAAFAALAVLRVATRAAVPVWVVALAAPLSTLALAAALFQAAAALGIVDASARPLRRRHGFAVIALGTCVALPLLGAFSLVDPWETHYAEVAREMIERRDFVSMWWGHEGWFMSKPVLLFWIEAIGMTVLGAGTGPDGVIANGAAPEWAVRAPGFAMALVGIYVLYKGVARTCSRRAGLLGALLAWTSAGFVLLTRQALTDTPLVASIAAALGFLLLAFASNDEARVRPIEVRVGVRAFSLHAGHALAAALVAVALPQLVMLALEHVHVSGSGLHLGPARFSAGSPHACGLPGQPECAPMHYAHPGLQPWIIVAISAPVVAGLVVRAATETRTARLYALAAWTCAALGVMAKGPVGLVIPAAAALVALLERLSFGRAPTVSGIRRSFARLEILVGLLLAASLVVPWYLAAYARHGRVFVDELVLRHMLGRTLEHLHDTNDGDDVGIAYFVKQLGYATFPWSGLVAAAFVCSPLDARPRRGAAQALLYGAALFTFALVSAMRTKFHHYALPALPPLCALAGIWLDEHLASEVVSPARHRARLTGAAAAIGAGLVLLLVTRDLTAPSGAARLMHLLTYRYSRRWPSTDEMRFALAAFGLLCAGATLALTIATWRRRALAALAATAIAFAVFVADVYIVRAAPDGGQRKVLDAYYAALTSSEARDAPVLHAPPPLVAYQLNWKGENYYTGNHIAIFVSSGAPMRTWLDARRRAEERTIYFVTEIGRVNALRTELGAVRAFEQLTGSGASSEFCLVRAEL